MSKLQDILVEAKRGLLRWESIPEQQWPAIASQCGVAELEEIDRRISHLEGELATTEEWDGDVRDEIWRAIEMFRALADLINTSKVQWDEEWPMPRRRPAWATVCL